MSNALWVGLLVMSVVVGARAASTPGIEVWTTHSLDKTFPDSIKPDDAATSISVKAARNEAEDAQILLRTPKEIEVTKARFSLPDLEGPGDARISHENLSASWVWYTYVLSNPKDNTDPSTYLRKAPAFFPDAFLEQSVIRIRDEWTQPLWLTVRVPKGTPPGEYTGTLMIDCVEYGGEQRHFDVPVSVTVWPFTLPDEGHLRHTEWFYSQTLTDYYHIQPWSEKHWEWLTRVAQDMGRHRQDTILTPFVDLVDLKQNADGAFTADFTRLDRWIETFRNAGVTWIEGGHATSRESGWFSPYVWIRFPVQGPDGQLLNTWSANPEFEQNLYFRSHRIPSAADAPSPGMTLEEFEPHAEAFYRLIHAHLKEKGWADRYVQHIGDEPVWENQDSWVQRGKSMRAWMPGIPIIDAVMLEGLEGVIDIRVPQIQDTKPAKERNASESMWSYVCLYPQQEYPNRFLDYPSVRNRILFWLSWTRELDGFLHWGYNSWQAWQNVPVGLDVSPWQDATGGSVYVADRMPLPAGDPYIVYPGKNTICSSIRWEVVRKGMEDFEYLYMLNEAVTNPKPDAPQEALDSARALLDRVRTEIAVTPENYTRDEDLLMRTREEAGALLAVLVGENQGDALSTG